MNDQENSSRTSSGKKNTAWYVSVIRKIEKYQISIKAEEQKRYCMNAELNHEGSRKRRKKTCSDMLNAIYVLQYLENSRYRLQKTY